MKLEQNKVARSRDKREAVLGIKWGKKRGIFGGERWIRGKQFWEGCNGNGINRR